MNSQFLKLFLFLSLLFPLSLSDPDPDQYLYSSCSSTFNCGSIAGVGYPFRGYDEPEFCGYPGMVLNCRNNNITTLDMNNVTFRVLGINQAAQTLDIAREDVMESTCPQDLVNTTLDNSLFQFSSSYLNLTFLYGCPASVTLIPGVDPISTCNISGYSGVYLTSGAGGGLGCQVSVTVPANGWIGSVNSTALQQAIQGGFGVRWEVDSKTCSECTGSGGRCGYSPVTDQTTCYCPNPPYVSGSCVTAAGAPSGSTPAESGDIGGGTSFKSLASSSTTMSTTLTCPSGSSFLISLRVFNTSSIEGRMSFTICRHQKATSPSYLFRTQEMDRPTRAMCALEFFDSHVREIDVVPGPIGVNGLFR